MQSTELIPTENPKIIFPIMMHGKIKNTYIIHPDIESLIKF